MRMDYAKNDAPVVFVGSRKHGEYGKDSAHFTMPTSVACDKEGRVYVSDYWNNRVQVFSPQGRSLRIIE